MSVIQEVIQREKEWAAAIQARDLPSLERILGEEYSLRARGREASRAEWLGLIPSIDTMKIDVREASVNGYGAVAVAKVTLHWHARFTGRAVEVWRTTELDEDFQITDVWVRREGRWQVVSRTSMPIPKPS